MAEESKRPRDIAGASSASFSVAIVDDHRMVAESLAGAISSRHSIIGLARNSAEALALAVKHRPELFLVDISLGNENGLDLLPRLLTLAPGTAIIVVTMFATPGFQTRAFELGAKGFISKAASTQDLLDAIDVVGSGGIWSRAGPEAVGSATSALDSSIRLTLRQIEVVRHLSRGMSYKEIGCTLGMTENTVDVHLRRIRQILGGRNAVDLVWQAARHGFIAADATPWYKKARSEEE
jgi:DNA-binding NarL/FixJ family response regulator